MLLPPPEIRIDSVIEVFLAGDPMGLSIGNRHLLLLRKVEILAKAPNLNTIALPRRIHFRVEWEYYRLERNKSHGKTINTSLFTFATLQVYLTEKLKIKYMLTMERR